jgi:hypothetical protein
VHDLVQVDRAFAHLAADQRLVGVGHFLVAHLLVGVGVRHGVDHGFGLGDAVAALQPTAYIFAAEAGAATNAMAAMVAAGSPSLRTMYFIFFFP